jgi:antitoxin component YwqK of YwqJK toxin-antitoxin module
MKRFSLFFVPLLSLCVIGCHHSDQSQDEHVVSKRYIHKYGYDVSEKEWKTASYPGQVITTLRNGITVTASYEDGLLHGPTTHTHPHSHTTESLSIYQRGNLVKKTSYNVRGIPFKEEAFFSPSHTKITRWYASGTPLSVEEYHRTELLEGEYYNKHNEVIERVSKGTGMRIVRDQHEQVIAKETIDHGFPALRETFHPHGIPHTIVPLLGGQVHGEKKVFAPSGEPISLENYSHNLLHGQATYFQNGCRYLEMTYQNGVKHGIERHFIDGETVVEETEWHEGQKHGPSIVYFDSMSKTQFYYNNMPVSKERYRELIEQEENIAIMNDRAKQLD